MLVVLTLGNGLAILDRVQELGIKLPNLKDDAAYRRYCAESFDNIHMALNLMPNGRSQPALVLFAVVVPTCTVAFPIAPVTPSRPAGVSSFFLVIGQIELSRNIFFRIRLQGDPNVLMSGVYTQLNRLCACCGFVQKSDREWVAANNFCLPVFEEMAYFAIPLSGHKPFAVHTDNEYGHELYVPFVPC